MTTTKLTFGVDDCEGCEIQLTSALGTIAEANAGAVDIWTSKNRTGDTVTLEQAVTKKRASACWEGVRSREVTVPSSRRRSVSTA